MVEKLTRRGSSVAILLLFLLLISARTAESLHGQMMRLGAYLWSDYFALRDDVPTPSCDPHLNIEARLNELETAARNADDEFDLLEENFDREAARSSLERQKALCLQEHERAARYRAGITAGLRFFRSLERPLAQVSMFAAARQQLLLLLLLFVAAITATYQGRNIALRPTVSIVDHRISLGFQLLANGLLAFSAWVFSSASYAVGAPAGSLQIINGLAFGFTLLAVVCLLRLLATPGGAAAGGRLLHALLSVPLYAIALLIFAFVTFAVRKDPPALAIYLTTFFERSGTYLDVALYLWSGMLLKQTQLAERVFSLFTPLRLGPELLAFIAVIIGALPTAYTGASAIIILAAGDVVYRELRKLGTRRQLALAATAMSGTAGVVLEPCLLVVLISILDKQVLSGELFYWGGRVFLLVAGLFALCVVITARDPFRVAWSRKALGTSLGNLWRLIPYVVIFGLLMGIYAVVLDAHMDQFSAPTMLPVLLVGVVVFERWLSRAEPIYRDAERAPRVMGAVTKSVSDASVHVGALLLLMAAFSVMTGLGGKMASATFLGNIGSVAGVMAVLVIMFILIGMFMESMAAVGMVFFMIAPVVYAQGISPVHFWMTFLVALSLGYLTPPVALSHIFTRQVVGEDEWNLAAKDGDTFYYRHERLLLPLAVMGTTLLIVAFGPLLFGRG
jgi:TRAP-type C4-dicarboxylate transport system permease large subunit